MASGFGAEGLEAELAAQLATEGVYAPMPSMVDAMAAMSAMSEDGAGAGAGAPAPPPAAAAQQQQQQVDPKMIAKWPSLYCCYVNASLSEARGRRVPLSVCAGCENPSIHDLIEAAIALGYNSPGAGLVLENTKRHPRDPWMPGRLRVRLRLDNGMPTMPGIGTKRELLAAIAAKIPTLPGRLQRLNELAHMRAEYERRNAAALKGQKGKVVKAAAEGAAQTGGAAGKKGRK